MALQEGDVLPEHGDGDGVDGISDLPDELLLKVLACLGSAREAARTGVLSSRWCGLWTRLSEYTFRDVKPEAVEAALANVTLPALDRLDIEVLLNEWWDWDPVDRAASLLRAAARLSIESVSVVLEYQMGVEVPAIVLPCFDRTSSLILNSYNVPFAPPRGGEFSRLERLELTTGCNIFAALLPNCPRLRVLRIHGCQALEVTVHSATLEELAVECASCSGIRRIDVDTPQLKEANLELNRQLSRWFDVSFSAPKVEKHSWKFTNLECHGDGIPLEVLLGCSLKYGIRTLRLEARMLQFGLQYPNRSLAQEIARLPMADFSVLEVAVHTQGHYFGSLLLHLLQIPPAIQKLELFIYQLQVEEDIWCPGEDCPCQQLIVWKNETIFLSDLKEVHISYLPARGDEEVDFLKLLFRCAPGLKRLDVAVDDKLHEEIRSIYGENPHAKCDVRSCSW
ncbi:hypothetical protein EJB05_34643 [Eragrostis curvula]|uniref:FBD domain-containing protein n=1 Tax=Eragrostis curvula TaxID=38414 RepID=A0A5J9U5I7_9POAL|nr:hypothetical protein EJB05_34643 [Eragrostis curvula]